MKQFQVMNPSSYDTRILDEGLALSMVSTATDSLLLQWCPVGGQFIDYDGFEWERLPDVP